MSTFLYRKTTRINVLYKVILILRYGPSVDYKVHWKSDSQQKYVFHLVLPSNLGLLQSFSSLLYLI